jgi:hypothetical protein
MVDPDRSLLQDLVEIDETEMPFRSKHDPVDRPRGGSLSRMSIGDKSSLPGAMLHSVLPHDGWLPAIPSHAVRAA